MSRAALLLLPLLLGSCISHERRAQRPVWPWFERTQASDVPSAAETQACFADLSREEVRYSPLPDRDYGGGCRVIGAVQLRDIGVPVAGITAMRCGLARSFTGWIEHGVAPAARQMLGSDVVRIESMGTYACRAVVGSSNSSGAGAGRLSGHAFANAVDVSGFVLRDGRRITLKGGWNGDDPAVRDFLRTVRASACRRFGTVLSPDYNAAHHDHLHLEGDRAGFCR